MSNCLKCESVRAFQITNFPVKTPNLDVLIGPAFPGFPHRLLIGLGVNVRAAHDVPVRVTVVDLVIRHVGSPTYLNPTAGNRSTKLCADAAVRC
jgi:hypothetical protein